MENLTDYSQYVNAAYLIAGLTLGMFFSLSLLKYLRIKGSREKDEK